MHITCPTGFAVEARRFKGQDVLAIADRSSQNAIPDRALAQIINGVWTSTIDAGIYSFVSLEGRPDWARILKGDLLALLFRLRVGSFRDGRRYPFPVKCQMCKKRYEWEIDLAKTVLPREKPLPEKTRDAIINNVHLEARAGDHVYGFKLPTVADEEIATKLRRAQVKRQERQNEQAIIVDALATQIVTVDGQKKDGQWIWRHCVDLDLDDIYSLRDQFDAADCGFDLNVRTSCTHADCGWEQHQNLPLVPAFLDPPRQLTEAEQARRRNDETDLPEMTPTPPAEEANGSPQPSTTS